MKILFSILFTLLLFYVTEIRSQDCYSGDTLYIYLSEAEFSDLSDTVIVTTLESEKNFPEYFRVGKHHIKNPLFTIAADVAGKDKATTIVLVLLTGPLGGHRLYLGTKPIVPVVYTLTLGGGVGILPFIDLVVVCFSKDMSRFENNNKIFMWAK